MTHTTDMYKNIFLLWTVFATTSTPSPDPIAHKHDVQDIIPYQAPLSLAIQLHIAVKSNDVAFITHLITQGVDVNHQDTSFKNTPLFYAIQNKNNMVVRLLINAGAHATAGCCFKHSGGYIIREPLLFYAVRTNNSDSIRTLCTEGNVDPDSINFSKQCALAIAARGDNTASIEALYQAGASIEKKDHWGDTALQIALLSSSFNAFKQLLALGAGANELEHLQEASVYSLLNRENYKLLAFCIERGAAINHPIFSIKKATTQENRIIQKAHRNAKKAAQEWLCYTEKAFDIPRDLSRLIGAMVGLNRKDNLPLSHTII